MEEQNDWTIEDANKFYQIDRWGQGYFSVNELGRIAIHPNKENVDNKNGPVIDILDVINEIKDQKIAFPVVVRFHDILRNRVMELNKTFTKVIETAEYKGKYTGVYPIKVNQMREVVEEILDAGEQFNFGLEAGSKPELLAALAMNQNQDALTVLNGYKDKMYLRLALLGRKLGRKVIIVIEKYSELIETLEVAEEMKIDPIIGFRAKLSSRGTGKWSESGGDRAKFGLTTAELLRAVELLKKENKLEYVKLFHFHIGSQITDIRTIKDAITEGTRLFVNLIKQGVPLEYLDVGGGLGIDYDGSKSTMDSSTNYSITDYVEDVVYIIKQICDLEKIPHPNIVSESGRAIAAGHSCVIIKAFDQIRTALLDYPIEKDKSKLEHVIVSNFRDLWNDLTIMNYQETYNDARQLKEESINAFKLGVLSLQEKATIETLYWKICYKISEMIKGLEFVPEDLEGLADSLATQYLCNCSFFQSVPDSWAIDQLFPVVPLMRLNEEPTVRCTLADITCDSDGKIDEFIGNRSTQKTLPLHTLNKDEEYYLGIFLTGAYQDVMGDMHNLFGKLHEVHIFCDDEDPTDFYIEEVVKGHSARDILSDMQYNTESMAYTIKKALDKKVQEGKISPREGVRLTDFYEDSLDSYTYLEK